MKSAFTFIIFILLFSCGKHQENEKTKEIPKQNSTEKKPVIFKKIIFSIEPGFSEDRRSKDFEITESDSIYYRTRENNRILENFTAKINSKEKQLISEILDSLNLNVLKTDYDDELHAPYYSLKVSFNKGDFLMQGSLPNNNHGKQLFKLLNLVEKLDLKSFKNKRFSTAKDVLLPQPPGQKVSSLVSHDSL